MSRLTLCTRTLVGLVTALWLGPLLAAPGALDTTFGPGTGKVITPISAQGDEANAVALQPDGKIVVAGLCYVTTPADFCLARYTAAGVLDTSFGTAGKVITAIVTGHDEAHALALQPDGKIVLAGYCAGSGNKDFCLARYTAAGALDTSFNATGKVITPIGTSDDVANAVALQPDGKIVLAGYCSNGSNNDFCLARYDAMGALDTSFNATGTVITPIGTLRDEANAVALQPDGKIIVAGYCYNNSTDDFCVARYTAAGALDTSFNATGKVITPIGTASGYATAIALQPDGKIVVVGYCVNGSTDDFCLARYLTTGALDASFGTAGKVTTAIGTSSDTARAVALQPDGKIVVAGHCFGGGDDFCLARYLPSGALDASFNSTGTRVATIGSSQDRARAVALQRDGKIVVAGYCVATNNDFCLARFEGGPFDAKNCSLDIDGDGVTLATTDGLIATRVMLGLTGNAVIDSISFASHASRQTWTDIRNYLITQCGMSVAP